MVEMERDFYFDADSIILFNTISTKLRSAKIVYGVKIYLSIKTITVDLRCKRDSKTYRIAKECGFYEVQKYY